MGLHSNMAAAASNLPWPWKPPFQHGPQSFHSQQPLCELVPSEGELGLVFMVAWPLQESFPSGALWRGGETPVAQPCLQPRQGDKYLRCPGSSALSLPNIVHAGVGFCPGKWFHVLPRWYFVRHSQSFCVESLCRNTCFREVASGLFIRQSLGPHDFRCAGPRKHSPVCHLEIQPEPPDHSPGALRALDL